MIAIRTKLHRAMTPNSNSAEAETLYYNAPTPKFHHPVFTRSEVIVLTNTSTNKQTNPQTHKQTDATENTQRSSLRHDVG